MLKDFYLTFGLKYPEEPHPYWSGADGKGWVRISANDEEEARDIAFQFFGPRWAFIYPEDKFDRRESRRFYPNGELLRLVKRDFTVPEDKEDIGYAVAPTGTFTKPLRGDW